MHGESPAFLKSTLIRVASANRGKIEEFLLGVRLWEQQEGSNRDGAHDSSPEWKIEAVPGIAALPACVEDGLTFSENAQKKALHYSRLVSGLVLGDDSGLEVDALNGAPGVWSRRFAGPGATDDENNAKLLGLLSGVAAPQRTAQFVCVLALALDGKLLAEFRGVAHGVIAHSPRGTAGFGYDPLFVDPDSNKTFAEFPPEEKWRRSHRGHAMRQMLQWLAEQSYRPESWNVR